MSHLKPSEAQGLPDSTATADVAQPDLGARGNTNQSRCFLVLPFSGRLTTNAMLSRFWSGCLRAFSNLSHRQMQHTHDPNNQRPASAAAIRMYLRYCSSPSPIPPHRELTTVCLPNSPAMFGLGFNHHSIAAQGDPVNQSSRSLQRADSTSANKAACSKLPAANASRGNPQQHGMQCNTYLQTQPAT